MSRTYKTKPPKFQIDDYRRKHGRVAWHKISFRRSGDERDWLIESANRKNKDWKDDYDY